MSEKVKIEVADFTPDAEVIPITDGAGWKRTPQEVGAAAINTQPPGEHPEDLAA